MNEDLKPYIKNLIRLREKRGLHQKQIAEIFGVTQQSVANWENGTRQMSIDMLIRMCLFYQVSLDEVCQLKLGSKPDDPDSE